ncbi:MAG TPA: VCBS repeat-containing protein [Chitinophagales bacterium]|nr:VCBS repeat-containing protein [Chitinophagales bacterium]
MKTIIRHVLLICFVFVSIVRLYGNNYSSREVLWKQIEKDTFPNLLDESAIFKIAEFSLKELSLIAKDTSKRDLALNRAYFYNILARNFDVADSLFQIAEKTYPSVYNEIIGYKAIADYLFCSTFDSNCKVDTTDILKNLKYAFDNSLITTSLQWNWVENWLLDSEMLISAKNEGWEFLESIDSRLIPKWEGGIVSIRRRIENDKEALLISGGSRSPLILLEKNELDFWIDKTIEAGLDSFPGGERLYVLDFNNDGYQDIFILRSSSNLKGNIYSPSLLKNKGDGTFEDITLEVNLNLPINSECACWFDIDGNGKLDVFIGGNGMPSRLFMQNDIGVFEENAQLYGLNTGQDKIRDCAVIDVNNDGWDDLYLSVFGGNNRMYIREMLENRYLFFVDKAVKLGVENPFLGGILKVGDFDGDSKIELLAGVDISFDSDLMIRSLRGDFRGRENVMLYKFLQNDSIHKTEMPIQLLPMRSAISFENDEKDMPSWFYIGGRSVLDLIPLVKFHYSYVPTNKSIPKLLKPKQWPNYAHSITIADVDGSLMPTVWVKGGGSYPIMSPSITGYHFESSKGHYINIQPVTESIKSVIGTEVSVYMKSSNGFSIVRSKKISPVDSWGGGAGQYFWWIPEGYKIVRVEVKWTRGITREYLISTNEKRILLYEKD